MTTIFDISHPGCLNDGLVPQVDDSVGCIDESLCRKSSPGLPEVAELDVVRHYTRLSQRNFSIDSHFYPLGSCTMKYNPRAVHALASLPGFANRHPMAAMEHSQGYLQSAYELQVFLKEITGMKAVSLTPMAGAQGELAGCAMIKAYHQARNDNARVEMIVPDAAHGTNPATAVMCGFKVREVPTKSCGDVDIDALREMVGPQTAGIMLTNPSTLGVFERKIKEIAGIMHEAGGLLYYDGANLNAIVGKTRPGDMGFDVMHINLHKTFATPHGGGGPGAGPVAVSERLVPFLPTPTVTKDETGYRWLTKKDKPQSIGRLSAFMGNAGILLRANIYMRLLGREGLKRIAEFATLNANYLMKRLAAAGFDVAFPQRRASHEFIITFKNEKKQYQVAASDVAKRLLDYGIHAPTMYFPLLVPECWLIEPTETENCQTLDRFVDVMLEIKDEIKRDPDFIRRAPHSTIIRRLDEVKAAKELNLVHRRSENEMVEDVNE